MPSLICQTKHPVKTSKPATALQSTSSGCLCVPCVCMRVLASRIATTSYGCNGAPAISLTVRACVRACVRAFLRRGRAKRRPDHGWSTLIGHVDARSAAQRNATTRNATQRILHARTQRILSSSSPMRAPLSSPAASSSLRCVWTCV